MNWLLLWYVSVRRRPPLYVKYRLLMYIGEQYHYIGEGEDMFDNLKDICSKLSGFFYFIESQTHIPLEKHLEVSESLKKQMERITSNVFDSINVW